MERLDEPIEGLDKEGERRNKVVEPFNKERQPFNLLGAPVEKAKKGSVRAARPPRSRRNRRDQAVSSIGVPSGFTGSGSVGETGSGCFRPRKGCIPNAASLGELMP